VPKQFDVNSLTFVNFGLDSRRFDVTLKGKSAGEDDQIDVEDKGESEDLTIVRYILTEVAAAYGKDAPVAFTLTLDDEGKIVVPPAPGRALR